MQAERDKQAAHRQKISIGLFLFQLFSFTGILCACFSEIPLICLFIFIYIEIYI